MSLNFACSRIARLLPRYRKYSGWVDGAHGGGVKGWACVRFSSERLLVCAEMASGRVVRSRADIYRADVQRAGHSQSGYCGFSFSASLCEDGPIRIFIDAIGMELGGSPAAVREQPPAARVTKRATAQDDAWIALDDGARPSGWVFYPHAPTSRPLLHLECAGDLLESCRATIYRPDAERQTGDGWRGFAFSSLPARRGAYLIRDAETGLELHTFTGGSA